MDPYPSRCAERFTQTRHRSAWQLIKSYWQSQQRFPVYLFFTIVMVMTVPLVGVDIVYNYWYNSLYDVLQSYGQHGAIRLFIIFSTLGAFFAVFALYRFTIAKLFVPRARHWLIQKIAASWLRKRGDFYTEQVDNPRMQEDFGSLINFSIDFSMVLIGIISTFLIFIYYLWLVAGEFAVSDNWVWIGVAYAMVGTLFTIKFGRPFSLKLEQRRAGVHRRGKHVASLNRKRQKKNIFLRVFGKALKKRNFIYLRQKFFACSAVVYNQMLIFIPLMVALPGAMDKAFLIGWFIQSLQAFNRVQESLPSIVDPCLTKTNHYAARAKKKRF